MIKKVDFFHWFDGKPVLIELEDNRLVEIVRSWAERMGDRNVCPKSVKDTLFTMYEKVCFHLWKGMVSRTVDQWGDDIDPYVTTSIPTSEDWDRVVHICPAQDLESGRIEQHQGKDFTYPLWTFATMDEEPELYDRGYPRPNLALVARAVKEDPLYGLQDLLRPADRHAQNKKENQHD